MATPRAARTAELLKKTAIASGREAITDVYVENEEGGTTKVEMNAFPGDPMNEVSVAGEERNISDIERDPWTKVEGE